MNAGFSNLDYLRQQLLSKALPADVSFDAVITAIGLGVFGLIEKFCNRKFMWQIGWQQVFGADSSSFMLERFPIITPITLVEYKQDEPTGWVTEPQINPNDNLLSTNPLVIRSVDAQSGIIYFPDDSDCGDYWSQMRFTYTGGYWWEQAEPEDPVYPTPVPAGAPLLPDSVRLAWILQCRQVWRGIDKLGMDILKEGGDASVRFPEDWAPGVENILRDWVRMKFV